MYLCMYINNHLLSISKAERFLSFANGCVEERAVVQKGVVVNRNVVALTGIDSFSFLHHNVLDSDVRL